MRLEAFVTLAEVQQHEARTNANSRLGGYDMDKFCPLSEFVLARVVLEASDTDRVFLLGEFAKSTRNGTGSLRDVELTLLSDQSRNRVLSFLSPSPESGFASVDLCDSPHLALVAVTNDMHAGTLTLIDGNHRAIAQFLKQASIGSVSAYACAHPNIHKWPYVPIAARHSQRT